MRWKLLITLITLACFKLCLKLYICFLQPLNWWLGSRVVNPDPNWILVQQLCGSGSVFQIQIRIQIQCVWRWVVHCSSSLSVLSTMLFYSLFRKDNLKEWRDNYISQIEVALHKAVSNLYRWSPAPPHNGSIIWFPSYSKMWRLRL